MKIVLDSLQIGMIYAILAFGIYISFRILSVPDLTTEGSFMFGMAVSARLANTGHPVLALFAAMAAGAASGAVTALMQTRLKIHPILAGIITTSGLYSVNLLIQGRAPNVPVPKKNTIFTMVSFLSTENARTVLPIVITVLAGIALVLFFHTHLGMCIRAVGDNEAMVRASSINTDACKIQAFCISNAFIALSGAVLAQHQRFTDINAGTGTLVVGLASVIIGEAFFGRRGVTIGFLSAMVGSIIYRLILAYAMEYSPLEPFMLKLVSAVIVALALSLPALRGAFRETGLRRRGRKNNA